MLQRDRDAVPGRQHVHDLDSAAPASLNAAAAVARGGGRRAGPPGAFARPRPAHLGRSAGRRRRCSGARAPERRATRTASTRRTTRRARTGSARARPRRRPFPASPPGRRTTGRCGPRTRVGDTLANGGVDVDVLHDGCRPAPGAFSKSRRRTGRTTGPVRSRSRGVRAPGRPRTSGASRRRAASCTTTWTSTPVTTASVAGSRHGDVLLAGAGEEPDGRVDANGGTWWSFRTR